MELEVFAKMFQFASGKDAISSGKITAEDFEKLLREFNAIEEHEGKGYKKDKPEESEKLLLLQKALNKILKENTVDIRDLKKYAYTKEAGASNRNAFLCPNGKPLNQNVYEGTILPSSCK